ncbi:hypothetical protein N7493_007808 [Penicillium malachiteum]|uniref:Uncharacterized protein n=1 Tax=Penicillium malachiteum TaxID=1324776 RepID=A0AAD6HJ33_9EURO|nr:hypothetical protein N7493_007808 [Penicillium malachiteum]
MTSKVPSVPDFVSLGLKYHPRDSLEPDLESQLLNNDSESTSRFYASMQVTKDRDLIPTPPFLLSKKEKSESPLLDSNSTLDVNHYMQNMEDFVQHLKDTSRVNDYIQIWGRLIPASTPQ